MLKEASLDVDAFADVNPLLVVEEGIDPRHGGSIINYRLLGERKPTRTIPRH